jgi:signal transduction histidine kinase
MEDGSQLIDREEVVVNDILDEIADELETLSDEHPMVLRLDIGERIVVYGNQSLLSSIFRNLTENALAYSGGKNIYVTLVSHEKGF